MSDESSTTERRHELTEGVTPIVNGEPSDKGKEKEEPVEEDELYFLNSSFVYFQVENHIFHVPSYRFTMESHVFAGMFRLPQSNLSDIEGATRGNPIILPVGISCVDFRNFLKALYPLAVGIRLSLSKVEWLSVLKLSSFWYFLGFRKMAIAELQDTKALTPTEKITWGRDVKISLWVVQGYKELIHRSDTISKEEALIIGYETTFSLFRLREKRLLSQLLSLLDSVEGEFKAELEDIRAEEKGYNTEGDSENIKFETNEGAVFQGQADMVKENKTEESKGSSLFGNGFTASSTTSVFTLAATTTPAKPSIFGDVQKKKGAGRKW